MLRLALLACAARVARAHGSLVSPPSRNAVDGRLPRFSGGAHSACACGDSVAGCALGTRQGMSGQPCFWFSQGCFIGCANCTDTDIQPDGMPRAHEGDGPHASCAPADRPAGSSSQPTLPKRLWTVNRAAVEFSDADVYRFHPWRAPGSAPVVDACGVAGGTTPRYAGPGHTVFSPVELNGSRLAQGDRGSEVLPRGPPAATWEVGGATRRGRGRGVG